MLVVTGSIGFGLCLPAVVPCVFFLHGASVSENWSRCITVSWFSSACTTRICFPSWQISNEANHGIHKKMLVCKAWPERSQKPDQNSTQDLLLVGGFNPIWKQKSSKLESFPNRDEHKKIFETTHLVFFVLFLSVAKITSSLLSCFIVEMASHGLWTVTWPHWYGTHTQFARWYPLVHLQ